MKNDNTDIQIVFDGFAQTLEEIKDAVMKNPQSALTTDLLNKIQKTIDQSKEGITAEELETFRQELIDSVQQMSEKTNESFIGFLNEKVEEMSQLSKRPTIVENRYSIDFKSSKTVIAIILLCFGIGVSCYFNYNQYQEKSKLKHNDIKYRYVQMKGGVFFEDVIYLNKSYAERPQYRDSILNQVIEFENLVRQKAYNESVKEQKEKDSKQIDKRLKELTK